MPLNLLNTLAPWDASLIGRMPGPTSLITGRPVSSLKSITAAPKFSSTIIIIVFTPINCASLVIKIIMVISIVLVNRRSRILFIAELSWVAKCVSQFLRQVSLEASIPISITVDAKYMEITQAGSKPINSLSDNIMEMAVLPIIAPPLYVKPTAVDLYRSLKLSDRNDGMTEKIAAYRNACTLKAGRA